MFIFSFRVAFVANKGIYEYIGPIYVERRVQTLILFSMQRNLVCSYSLFTVDKSYDKSIDNLYLGADEVLWSPRLNYLRLTFKAGI